MGDATRLSATCWVSVSGPVVSQQASVTEVSRALVCAENLIPDIVVMKSAKDGVRFDAPNPLNGTRDRRIFI